MLPPSPPTAAPLSGADAAPSFVVATAEDGSPLTSPTAASKRTFGSATGVVRETGSLRNRRLDLTGRNPANVGALDSIHSGTAESVTGTAFSIATATMLANPGEGQGEPIAVVPVVRSAMSTDGRGRAPSEHAHPKGREPPPSNPCANFGKVPEVGSPWRTPMLSFLTLGVVYGDIGTSPLYTISSIFPNGPNSNDDVIGALSLMIWAMILLVCCKYLTFVVMADDHGEGGTFAIYALMSRALKRRIKDRATYERIDFVLATLALIGVACVLADGVLTPAISVLGAVQGLSVINPDISNNVCVGVSCAILVVLFAVQPFGTSKVSSVFSPLMVIWFLSLLGMGIYNIAQDPSVFKAFSPSYGFIFFINNGYDGFAALGAVFLTVTGTEAMFADLGHFSAKGMRLCGMLFVVPCLLVCYLGQAAALIANNSIYVNVFYEGMPASAQIYYLVIATIAATIASQAMISASFSITSQAIKLGCFPRLEVRHTSETVYGQVYAPVVNIIYMILSVAVTAGFQSTTNIGYAYGVAVSSMMLLTTLFYCVVIVVVFQKHWAWAVLFGAFFGLIDGSFLAANLLKFTSGAWVAVVISVVIGSILTVWRWGRARAVRRQGDMGLAYNDLFRDGDALASSSNAVQALGMSLHSSNRDLAPKSLVPARLTSLPDSLVIYYSSLPDKVPAAFTHFLHRLPVRPATLVFTTVAAVDVPFVADEIVLAPVPGLDGVYRANIAYGYFESPPDALVVASRVIRMTGCVPSHVDLTKCTDEQLLKLVSPTLMLGRDHVECEEGAGIAHRILVAGFQMLSAVSRSAAQALNLPSDLVIEIGVGVPI